MQFVNELMLRGRIALVKSKLTLLNLLGSGAQKEHFMQSVSRAFPGMVRRDTAAMYARYRLSMYKLTLIKNYLTNLSENELSDFIDRHVNVDGQEHLEAIKISNAPVVFVTPHYGNFPAGCLKLIKEIGRDKIVNVFYNPPSTSRTSEGFEELFNGLGYGFNALFNDDKSVLKALRVLKRGEALTMMPDVFDVSGHVLYVPFFGKLVPAMAGTALLALKGKATVIVGYNIPGEGVGSTLRLGKPLIVEPTGDLETDIVRLTSAIFCEMERQIRQLPEHWVYLQGIGDLLANRLSLGTGKRNNWLDTLDEETRHFETLLPNWPNVMRRIKSMQAPALRPVNARSMTEEAIP